MLSFASDADIPPVFLSTDGPLSTADGDDGGEGTLGFHCNPPGLGRGAVAGPGGGAAFPPGFSNAAILSRSELTLGFGGELG